MDISPIFSGRDVSLLFRSEIDVSLLSFSKFVGNCVIFVFVIASFSNDTRLTISSGIVVIGAFVSYPEIMSFLSLLKDPMEGGSDSSFDERMTRFSRLVKFAIHGSMTSTG